MTNKIAKFEKVSFKQYLNSLDKETTFLQAKNDFEELKLPKRATVGSAGYDFYAPFDIELKPGETIKLPTGIRVKMENDWVLQMFPRSGLGFKYRLQLDNTVGIIDSDYYNSDNEGHIQAKITYDKSIGERLFIKKGTAFMQGIFMQYGITEDDNVSEIRNGGFGSTTK